MLEIIRGTARLYHTACSTVPCHGEMNYWPDEFVVGRVHITSGKGRTGCSTDINTDILGFEGGLLPLAFEGSVRLIIVDSENIALQHLVVSFRVVSCPSVRLIASPCSRVLPRKLAVCAAMWVKRPCMPASNCRPPYSVIRLRECTATNAPRLIYERTNERKRYSLCSPLWDPLEDFFKSSKPTPF